MKPKTALADGQIRLGEISGLHGVSGWVKLISDTQPRENLFSYCPLQMYSGEQVRQLEVVHWRKQGKTLVANLKGVSTREQARELIGAVIAVDADQLPDLDDGEFYWHQLIGMKVLSNYAEQVTDLGRVAELIETGSNDVLVVRSAEKEHLIPWIMDEFVLDIDVSEQKISVHWDPEF